MANLPSFYGTAPNLPGVPTPWWLPPSAASVQPLDTPAPLMAPNYVFPTPLGRLALTESWDSPLVTETCAVDPNREARCLDAVVRGGLSALTPVVGSTGTYETALPTESMFIQQYLKNAGFTPSQPSFPLPQEVLLRDERTF